jgi:hypothetical protein
MWDSDYTIVPSRMGSIDESIGIDADTRAFRIHSYESWTESENWHMKWKVLGSSV